MPRRNTLLLFLLVIGLFVLMTYQSRKGVQLSASPLSGIMNRSSRLVEGFADAVSSPFRKIAIRSRDIEDLRKQNDELLRDRAAAQEALRQNRRLEELLGLKARHPSAVVAASAIARGVDQWRNTLVIDRGADDGVAKDMSAITPKGLAGKVFGVSAGYANILLITDINFSAAVRLQESRREGVVSGTGRPRMVLKFIPYEDQVAPGDILVTSGLDRLFPPGIPVGFVSRVEKQGSGYFQDIEVTPFVDHTRLEEVLIVR